MFAVQNFVFGVRVTAFWNSDILSNDYLCGLEEVEFVRFLAFKFFFWLLLGVYDWR